MAAICIGPAQHLPLLLAHEKGARAFTDSDALRALRTVIDMRPDTILVDAGFAQTSRGAAFIQRIKTDAALTGCSVQLGTAAPRLRRPNPPRARVSPRRPRPTCRCG